MPLLGGLVGTLSSAFPGCSGLPLPLTTFLPFAALLFVQVAPPLTTGDDEGFEGFRLGGEETDEKVGALHQVD